MRKFWFQILLALIWYGAAAAIVLLPKPGFTMTKLHSPARPLNPYGIFRQRNLKLLASSPWATLNNCQGVCQQMAEMAPALRSTTYGATRATQGHPAGNAPVSPFKSATLISACPKTATGVISNQETNSGLFKPSDVQDVTVAKL